ncbi:MAG TPA: hypothetical protein VLT59_10750, partial [Steroidobacteraceae bacterium]|nr:hypothetical protein [Steroidobacteraceae bacterium]
MIDPAEPAIERARRPPVSVGAPAETTLPALDDEEPRSLTDQDLERIFVDEFEWSERDHRDDAFDRAPSAPAPPGEAADEESTDIVVEEPVGLEEITLEGRRIEISGTYPAPEDQDADREPAIEGVEIVLGAEEDEELLPPLPPDEILLPEDYAREEGFELEFTDVPETVGFAAPPDPEPVPVGHARTEADLNALVAALPVASPPASELEPVAS